MKSAHGPTDDPRVLDAAREYLAELEAGRVPDRGAYLQRHPDLAGALAECFDGIELAHAASLELGPAAIPTLEQVAGTLGDFQIIREIGRGGMGVVYDAVQLSLGRRVALKVLPFAAALDAKHLQRFKTEAQAAAQLHHTNIVPVFGVGCERGVHFYAMQLIEGRSLDAVIQELRGNVAGSPGGTTVDFMIGATAAASAPMRTSSRSGQAREHYRTAGRIAAQVADALHYAHEAGVVHRDIKPANLLLDARGNVWVTDFGLAQVSDVSLTRTGDVVGTLRYMSPEHASGQRVLVDQRTDVYSLGATLYELLTLEPIFPGQDRRTLLFQILNDEPRPPRQIDRAIPAELETIILKAVAKAPEERYATAADLAADLRRFLDERPILARRPSLVDRARKWMRRHPSLVASAVLLLVVVVVALAVTTALVSREQALTQAAYDRERQRSQEAEARFELAQRAADDLIRVAQEELADKPHLESVRKRLLESALTYYQELIKQRGEDRDARAELAETRDRVKQIIADLAALQGMGHLFLLEKNEVLDDLRASEEQRRQIADVLRRQVSQRQAWFHEFGKLTVEERREHFVDEARKCDSAIRAVLSANQLTRLRQIVLQVRGVAAFQEAEVVAALHLTAEQRQRLRGIEAETYFGKSPHWGGPGPRQKPPELRGGGPVGSRPGRPHGEPRRKIDEQAMKSAMTKALAVLTEEQAAKWQQMIGETFKGGFCSPPPGPPGMFGPR